METTAFLCASLAVGAQKSHSQQWCRWVWVVPPRMLCRVAPCALHTDPLGEGPPVQPWWCYYLGSQWTCRTTFVKRITQKALQAECLQNHRESFASRHGHSCNMTGICWLVLLMEKSSTTWIARKVLTTRSKAFRSHPKWCRIVSINRTDCMVFGQAVGY